MKKVIVRENFEGFGVHKRFDVIVDVLYTEDNFELGGKLNSIIGQYGISDSDNFVNSISHAFNAILIELDEEDLVKEDKYSFIFDGFENYRNIVESQDYLTDADNDEEESSSILNDENIKKSAEDILENNEFKREIDPLNLEKFNLLKEDFSFKCDLNHFANKNVSKLCLNTTSVSTLVLNQLKNFMFSSPKKKVYLKNSLNNQNNENFYFSYNMKKNLSGKNIYNANRNCSFNFYFGGDGGLSHDSNIFDKKVLNNVSGVSKIFKLSGVGEDDENDEDDEDGIEDDEIDIDEDDIQDDEVDIDEDDEDGIDEDEEDGITFFVPMILISYRAEKRADFYIYNPFFKKSFLNFFKLNLISYFHTLNNYKDFFFNLKNFYNIKKYMLHISLFNKHFSNFNFIDSISSFSHIPISHKMFERFYEFDFNYYFSYFSKRRRRRRAFKVYYFKKRKQIAYFLKSFKWFPYEIVFKFFMFKYVFFDIKIDYVELKKKILTVYSIMFAFKKKFMRKYRRRKSFKRKVFRNKVGIKMSFVRQQFFEKKKKKK